MPNVQATLVYDVNIVGNVLPATLEAEVAAVALDFTAVDALGYSLVSDATTIPGAGGTVARTIVLSLIQPTLLSVNNPFTTPGVPLGGPPTPPVLTNFVGSIRSTSASDTAAGTGARTVTIFYSDAANVDHTQTVALNGTTPVDLGLDNHCTIISVTLATVGSFGTSEGNLIVSSLTEEQLAVTTGEALVETIVAVLPAGSYVGEPTATGDPLPGLFTGQLQAALGYPVIAQNPVLA